MAVYMAVDVGTVRVGLALCDPLEISIRSLDFVSGRGREDAAQKVADQVMKNNPAAVVVGHPISLDGSRGPMAKKAEKFARCLADKIEVPVELMDERFSTSEAQRLLIKADYRRSRRKNLVDGIAAAIILQKFIDSKKQGATSDDEDS